MAKLRHVKSTQPGFSRKPAKQKGFDYYDEKGRRIRDKETLDRIRKLVIPPAWTEVWICPFPNGHLQATGIDKKGRKQYLYHADWKKAREETKYSNLLKFGEHLPLIRKRISQDLRKRSLEKEKVAAIALTVMEETLIRVGNTYYQQEYGSHGLTTLRNKHVRINGSAISFKFKGKKGVLHEVSYKDKRLAGLLKKMRELPGQELFQYYNQEGVLKTLGSGDINDYIWECTQCNFTSKDYRTWAGSVHALTAITECPEQESREECEKSTVKIIKEVAERLGNTAAVCKKYYIYPLLLDTEKRKLIRSLINGPGRKNSRASRYLSREEKVLLRILKQTS
ncbi:DNA topoisomerase-1 [Anseongella ginsenosidimutans]|uniref:DNA topoisomerase n=1 Tax=Anseongella ginsenosidimutans TaxID=496056 RepID=A0A4R3KQP6_9SPHI|nr:DNA topoisomerase IB [Anseongella ginsenosidimutans]QEC52854.1 DNA topoisomerase IB [Anseongella ginsenosidimutans]TCS87242.1 DNA topoisomerase-1 [Anseongella ginsenosidimutans]